MKEGNEVDIDEVLGKLQGDRVVSIDCDETGSHWGEECDGHFATSLTRDETILLAFWLSGYSNNQASQPLIIN